MSKKLYEIEVKAQEFKTKDGKAFIAFKALNAEGRWIDCKFRKEVKLPKGSGLINVREDKMSVDKNRKYPVLWIHEIESFTDLGDVAHDSKAVEAMFGGQELDEKEPTF